MTQTPRIPYDEEGIKVIVDSTSTTLRQLREPILGSVDVDCYNSSGKFYGHGTINIKPSGTYLIAFPGTCCKGNVPTDCLVSSGTTLCNGVSITTIYFTKEAAAHVAETTDNVRALHALGS